MSGCILDTLSNIQHETQILLSMVVIMIIIAIFVVGFFHEQYEDCDVDGD